MDIALREGLIEVAGSLPTYASVGVEHRAEAIGRIAASSYEYLAQLLRRRPEIQILVLSEADWATKGRAALFGLPNAGEGTLVVAGTEAPWWTDLAEMAPDHAKAEMDRVYAGSDGVLSLARFFDLVAVHEVGHVFCGGVVRFPRLWLGELFANLALHAWVAERAPEHLATLVTLPRLAAQSPGTQFECRTRDEFEQHYTSMGGPNYVWYEFRLQAEAARLFDLAGSGVVRRLFEAFRTRTAATVDETDEMATESSWHDAELDDAVLADRLAAVVDPTLGEFSLAF